MIVKDCKIWINKKYVIGADDDAEELSPARMKAIIAITTLLHEARHKMQTWENRTKKSKEDEECLRKKKLGEKPGTWDDDDTCEALGYSFDDYLETLTKLKNEVDARVFEMESFFAVDDPADLSPAEKDFMIRTIWADLAKNKGHWTRYRRHLKKFCDWLPFVTGDEKDSVGEKWGNDLYAPLKTRFEKLKACKAKLIQRAAAVGCTLPNPP